MASFLHFKIVICMATSDRPALQSTHVCILNGTPSLGVRLLSDHLTGVDAQGRTVLMKPLPSCHLFSSATGEHGRSRLPTT